MAKEIYIFIDESGDLGKFGTRYFIIAALCTEEPKPIYNIIKHIRERKLKKKLREISELKANNSNDFIRKTVLQKIVSHSCEFHILTVDKKQVRDYLFDNKNKLYNYLVGLLFEHIQEPYDKLHLIIDKKDNKSIIQEDFNNYIKNSKLKSNVKIEIEHLESHQNRGLQAVDFVAWSAHRKFNTNDDTFYTIIEPKIKKVTKLFSNK